MNHLLSDIGRVELTFWVVYEIMLGHLPETTDNTVCDHFLMEWSNGSHGLTDLKGSDNVLLKTRVKLSEEHIDVIIESHGFSKHDRSNGAVRFDDDEDACNGLDKLLSKRGRIFSLVDPYDAAFQFEEQGVEQYQEDRFFAVEILVKCTPGDASGRHDLGDGSGMIPALRKDPQGSGQDSVLPLLPLLLGSSTPSVVLVHR